MPRFNSRGLVTAVSQDAKTGQILMVAHMNEEALKETIETGRAVFYSRSRGKLWRKGEQSGHYQYVKEILTDCDQDSVVLKVEVEEGQCHVGYQSCFYRRVNKDGTLDTIAQKVYDPDKAYNK